MNTILKLLCIVAFGPIAASHAAWPERPISIVAPYTPGGNADIHARLVAQVLTDALGQTVLVENRPGAGGMLGAQYVARLPPDGYTFMVGAAAHVVGEFFYRNKLLDLRRDLVAVTQITSVPNYIVVAPNSRYDTLGALLEAARTQPDAISCATPGVGTVAHLVCELIKQRYGVKIPAVPYRGGAPAIIDVIGGQVTFFAGNEGLPFIRDHRLKGLAVTSLVRSPLAPDIAPVSDWLPGFDVSSWYGLFAPVGTPPDIVEQVQQVIAQALTTPAVQQRLAALGATPVGSTPQAFGAFIDAEFARWVPVTKTLNITLD